MMELLGGFGRLTIQKSRRCFALFHRLLDLVLHAAVLQGFAAEEPAFLALGHGFLHLLLEIGFFAGGGLWHRVAARGFLYLLGELLGQVVFGLGVVGHFDSFVCFHVMVGC
jgi:hypothetical protein